MEAVRLARSKFFSPRLRLKRALTPTPVPVETAIIRFCTGKARPTALKAFSLMRATKKPSTILYRADTSILSIIGADMVTSRRLTGRTPILFSLFSSILILSRGPLRPLFPVFCKKAPLAGQAALMVP